AELAQLLPIRTFIDHGSVNPEAERNTRGSIAMFEAYAAVRAKGRHLEPKSGERLALNGLDAVVVSTDGTTIEEPLAGAGGATPGCAAVAPPAQEQYENPRSSGFRLQFGRFRFLDLGDLSGGPLYALTCPHDLIGPLDVYLVAHHGGADAADPATFAAFRPRVAIINNRARKGGAPETVDALQRAAGIDLWQLHRSENPGAQNFANDRIANLDESTSHWIKLS